MGAVDAAATEYGVERMVKLLVKDRHLPPPKLLEQLRADTHAFHGEREAADDRTVLVVRQSPDSR